MVLEGSQRVTAAARGTRDPSHITAVTIAAHESEIGFPLLVPGPVKATAPHLLVIDRQRRDEECDVVFRHRKIMHGTHIGHTHFGIPDLPAGAIDLERRNDVAAEAAGFVTESDHVSSRGADLRVRGEGLVPWQLAAKGVDRIQSLEGVQLQSGGCTVLLERKNQIAVLNHVRVGRAAAQALHRGVVTGRVAVHRHQIAARRILGQVTLGSHVAAAVVDAAISDPEQPDVTLAIEGDVAGRQRILRIGAHGIEPAAEIGRKPAFDRTVLNVDFRTLRRIGGAKPGGFAHVFRLPLNCVERILHVVGGEAENLFRSPTHTRTAGSKEKSTPLEFTRRHLMEGILATSALGFMADANTAGSNPIYRKGQHCASCMHYLGTPSDLTSVAISVPAGRFLQMAGPVPGCNGPGETQPDAFPLTAHPTRA